MITEIDDLQSTNTNDVYLEGISNIPLIKGDKGNKGDKGDKGDIGPQGVQGPKGDKGDSYDDTKLKQDISDIEEELKQLQEDFYQSRIRGKVSGEYIHVEDSSGARCVIGIKGNHKQETRQGYNKLDESTLIDATAEGVNISYSNGKIKIEGTCTLATGQRLVTYIPITLEQGTYLFSCFGDYEYKYFTLRDNSNNYIQNLIQYNITGNQSRKITVTETTTYRISIHILAGKVYNNEINLMISEGTEEKDYEAFGVMPSPDYPSQIKTVGNNVNIFDITKYDYRNLVGANIQINDKTDFRITATAVNDNCAVGFKILDLTQYAGKTLTIKAYAKSSTSTNKAFLVLRQNNSDYTGTKTNELYDESQNTTDGFITLKYKITDVINDSNRFLFIFFYATRGTTASIGTYVDYQVKLVEGTEVGEYSKYGQGCVKLNKCNKNLFDKNADNLPALSGEYGLALSNFINESLLGKTVTLSFNTTMYFIEFASRESSGLVLFKYNSNYLTFEVTQELLDLKDERYLFIQQEKGVWISRKDTQLTYDIQLEEGTTATPYEEHQEQSYIMPIQQPMRSIGDIRDTFIKKENKWYERHYVQRLILNGTEGWNYDKNNNRFYFAKAGNKGSGYIMSSHYLRGDTTKQNNTCEIWSTAILFRDERFTEREDFKNMIKAKYDEGIPVYVDYVSITPTDIECTEEQSQILDELTNARTYKNVTNITTDSIAIIDLDYVKDLETLLNNMQALAVNNASEGV